MPSSTACTISTGASRLASSAASQVSRSHAGYGAGDGPALLVTRMSGAGHASSRAVRVAGSVTSPTIGVTVDAVTVVQLGGDRGRASPRRVR